MSSNKVTCLYQIASRTRSAIETEGGALQNKLSLNREWSVAILKYKLAVVEAKVN